MEKEKDVKNWDAITITLLVVSILTILFSFFAPIIFTGNQDDVRYDFNKTGDIGDTIGGLMNPFIALAGVFLTFMAFYMQIKANQIQLSQFKKGIQAEKEKDLRNEKLDCYHILSLLKHDLESITKDISSKASRIKEFYEKERDDTFDTNMLLRTPSKEYTRILEIDRLSIYKGFQHFLFQREDWVKIFSNLYNILDFLPEFFKNIYDIFERHSKDIFNQKMEVRNNLIDFMNMNSQLINAYKAEKPDEDYLNFPANNTCNQTILKYYDIIQESFDKNNNPNRETDFQKISDEVLGFFIQSAISQRNNADNFDRRLEPLIEFASDIRRKIKLIKDRMIEVSNNIEKEYNNLMVDNGDEKSYNNVLVEIKEILNTELQNIKIKEL